MKKEISTECAECHRDFIALVECHDVLEYPVNLIPNYCEFCEKDLQDKENLYCPVCDSCGEDGCCNAEKSLLNHGCKYGRAYANNVYYDKMIINEFHKFFESLDFGRDETGEEVVDHIGGIYDRAWKKVEEKYKK